SSNSGSKPRIGRPPVFQSICAAAANQTLLWTKYVPARILFPETECAVHRIFYQESAIQKCLRLNLSRLSLVNEQHCFRIRPQGLPATRVLFLAKARGGDSCTEGHLFDRCTGRSARPAR